MIRVLVADDQALVRGGFRLMIDAQPDMEVVGEAPDGTSAVAMACDLAPDVVLMDIRMPGMDGLEATRRILATAPAGGAGADPDHVRPRRVRLRGHPCRGERVPGEGRRPGRPRARRPHDRRRGCAARAERGAAAAGGVRPPSTAGSVPAVARHPDRSRARGAHAHRPGPEQRRDRRPAVHQRDDGADPRHARAAEARPARPDPGGGPGLRVGSGAARAGAVGAPAVRARSPLDRRATRASFRQHRCGGTGTSVRSNPC